MDKLAEFVARHPAAVGMVFAVLAGTAGWNAYRAGMKAQEIRYMVSESARAASEALGG